MDNHFKYRIRKFAYPVIISGLFVIAYADNLKWLWSRWMENPNYSHGPLIPLISLFVIFQKRAALKDIATNGSNSGIYMLLGAAIIYVVSLRAQVNFAISYSMILALMGIVLLIYGKKMLLALAFPIMYLFFMVPFWVGAINKFSNILKLLSSILTSNILQFLGYPIFRDGVILQLSRGSFEVADPCSGIRSLISLLALGTLIVYFSHGTLLKKVILVLFTIPLAVFGNTVRVVFFGVYLENTGILISEGFLHTLTGLGVFAFALIGLIAFKKCIRI